MLDNFGPDLLNPTSGEEAPEIVFFKKTSCSPNEDNSESKAKENVAVDYALDEHEPQIVFSSVTPIAPSNDITLIADNTKEDNLEILPMRKSPDLTSVSICFSPYSILPTRDKFAGNIGELELFENLTNSADVISKTLNSP